MNRLYAEGLVSLHEQRGFRVRTVSVDELQDLARTRCLVNEIGVREAIARGDAKWEEGIVLAFHRLMRARKELKENPGTYLEMERRHREFHAAIISSGRTLIARCSGCERSVTHSQGAPRISTDFVNTW